MFLSTKKQLVKVKMFDNLVGLGHGTLSSGERVYLNGLNVITENCYLGFNVGEEILCDIEVLEDGDYFARNIERISISQNRSSDIPVSDEKSDEIH